MNNNKGYSLTELLLAIFVLSIVMLGIAGILRSTSLFYRNGVQEVRVQEEAQLAVNLIEEMIVDAQSAPEYTATDDDLTTPDIDEYTRKITFKDEEGSDVEITYVHGGIDSSESEGTISYLPNDIIMNIKKTDGTEINNQILAEYVTSLDVDGADAPSTTGDNKLSISVGMDNNGYKFEASKEIYMRNLVENPTISIHTGSSGGGGGTPVTWNYEVVLNRYDSYNCTVWCKADPSKTVTPLNGFESDFDVNTTADGIVVTLKEAVCQNFSKSPTYSDAGLECHLKDDSVIRIHFIYYPVDISVSPNADIFIHYATDVNTGNGVNVNGAGYQTYVDVKGIDVNKAIASGKVSGSAKITLGVTKTFTLAANKTSVDNGQQFINQIDIGIIPDMQANGIVIAARNGAQIQSYTGDRNLEVEITLQPQSGSAYTSTLNYKFRVAGKVL